VEYRLTTARLATEQTAGDAWEFAVSARLRWLRGGGAKVQIIKLCAVTPHIVVQRPDARAASQIPSLDHLQIQVTANFCVQSYGP
jgi:hypothetical protein